MNTKERETEKMMMNNPTTLDLSPIPWTLDSTKSETFQEFRNPVSTIRFPTCTDSLRMFADSFVRGSFIEIEGERYSIKDHKGSGTYGFVASVESPGPLGTLGNTSYILKRIKCRIEGSGRRDDILDYNENVQSIIAECVNQQIISKFDKNLAPRIIKIAKNDYGFYIIMEFLDGINAAKHLFSQTSDDDRKNAIINMMRTIAKFTRSTYDKYHFIHGDMKPDNLLRLTDGTIRYIDFGMAKLNFDILNNATQIATQIITSPQLAKVSHPTRDLTMLAVWISEYYPVSNSIPIISHGLDTILKNAICDTSDIAIRGDVPVHAPHYLQEYPPPLDNPPNRRIPPGNGGNWGRIYRYLWSHVNINATPEKVLLAFPEAVAVAIADPIPPQPNVNMTPPESPDSPAGVIIQHNINDPFASASTSSPSDSTNNSSASTNISPIVGGFKKLTTRFLKKRSNKKKRNGHNKFIKSIKSIKNRQQTRSKSSKRRNNRNKTRRL